MSKSSDVAPFRFPSISPMINFGGKLYLRMLAREDLPKWFSPSGITSVALFLKLLLASWNTSDWPAELLLVLVSTCPLAPSALLLQSLISYSELSLEAVANFVMYLWFWPPLAVWFSESLASSQMIRHSFSSWMKIRGITGGWPLARHSATDSELHVLLVSESRGSISFWLPTWADMLTIHKAERYHFTALRSKRCICVSLHNDSLIIMLNNGVFAPVVPAFCCNYTLTQPPSQYLPGKVLAWDYLTPVFYPYASQYIYN